MTHLHSRLLRRTDGQQQQPQVNGPRDVGPLSFLFFYFSFSFWPASLIAAHVERAESLSLSYPTVIASSIANSPAKEINTRTDTTTVGSARALVLTHKMVRNDDDGGLIV